MSCEREMSVWSIEMRANLVKGIVVACKDSWEKLKNVSRKRAFSLTWPASMQIYWNKRKRLHKKRVQLPQDWFGTPTWPPFHCFGTPIWPPWRHVKTLYRLARRQYCLLLLWSPAKRPLRLSIGTFVLLISRVLNFANFREPYFASSNFRDCKKK